VVVTSGLERVTECKTMTTTSTCCPKVQTKLATNKWNLKTSFFKGS
jgi:RNA polymerase subunit RPABC4/transcription elongation factor Spt4